MGDHIGFFSGSKIEGNHCRGCKQPLVSSDREKLQAKMIAIQKKNKSWMQKNKGYCKGICGGLHSEKECKAAYEKDAKAAIEAGDELAVAKAEHLPKTWECKRAAEVAQWAGAQLQKRK